MNPEFERDVDAAGDVGYGWCTAPVAERGATIAEGDEPDEPTSDNSLGRLLALSDGVFAIAMTLLALDLRLPDLGTDPSDAQLRHALGDDWRSYLAFVISFYVAANYWGVHRRAMRAVTTIDTRLISHTLPLLLLVAALPFPASVLATYGDLPTALAFYSAFNVVANLALIRLLTRSANPATERGRHRAARAPVGEHPRPAAVHPRRLRAAGQRAVALAVAHRLRPRSSDPPGTPRSPGVTAARASGRPVAAGFHATRARQRSSPVAAARSSFRALKRASPSSGVRRTPRTNGKRLCECWTHDRLSRKRASSPIV